MELIRDLLRGVVVGVANIIPGVSGGTLLVSMGVYPEVIGAVTGFFGHWKKSVRLLLPYALGMALGVAVLSFAVEMLFARYPLQTACLFTGLIFGGLPLILKKTAGRPRLAECLAAACAFGLVIWMQSWGAGGGRVPDVRSGSAVILFFLGIIGAATMVIPGVSGSMVLMALGYYTPLLGQIHQFFAALICLDVRTMASSLGILAPFGLGIAAGVFLTAGLIAYLLSHWERMTYFVILGLLLASPAAVFHGIGAGEAGIGAVLPGALLFFLGVFSAWLFNKE